MSATTITLTGGRGTVVGEVIHANPNYTFLVDAAGKEITVPAELIAEVTRCGSCLYPAHHAALGHCADPRSCAR